MVPLFYQPKGVLTPMSILVHNMSMRIRQLKAVFDAQLLNNTLVLFKNIIIRLEGLPGTNTSGGCNIKLFTAFPA